MQDPENISNGLSLDKLRTLSPDELQSYNLDILSDTYRRLDNRHRVILKEIHNPDTGDKTNLCWESMVIGKKLSLLGRVINYKYYNKGK